jgi:hypothetical protein
MSLSNCLVKELLVRCGGLDLLGAGLQLRYVTHLLGGDDDVAAKRV